AHGADGVSKPLVIQGTGHHEVQLANEDVAARELIDQCVQKWHVLRLQCVPPWPEGAYIVPSLEEQANLVGVHGQLAPEGKRLVAMLGNYLVFRSVLTRNHHSLHATRDEIYDAHASAYSCIKGKPRLAAAVPEPLVYVAVPSI